MRTMLWWNVNTRGAGRLTDRLATVVERLAATEALVIGLSEAGDAVQPALNDLAVTKGYAVHRADGMSRQKGMCLLTHQSLGVSGVVAPTAHETLGKITSHWVGAVVEGLMDEPTFVASVYNYHPHTHCCADAIAESARAFTAGRLIVGGDWNFSRRCDGTHLGSGYGSPAFARLERDLGWRNLLPTDEEGRSREVPTWPMHKGRNRPGHSRQLDHVFADANSAQRLSVGVDDHVSFGEMVLSDHAILTANIEG